MSGILIIDLVLLALVLIAAVATVESRNLFAAAVISSIYSLLMACFWTSMDAVDVAYTEAAVGAGISTILLIGTLVLTGSRETVRKVVHWPALLLCLAVGGVLIYGTLDMPAFGDPKAPAHEHQLYAGYTKQNIKKAPGSKSAKDYQEYLKAQKDGEHVSHGEESEHDEHGGHNGHAHQDYFHGHVPNQVTSIIVAYRGFDTMFETCVIFCAGVGMIVLLRGRRGNPMKGGLL
jgi:multicomponent Na+:H+ antiporter subunit B